MKSVTLVVTVLALVGFAPGAAEVTVPSNHGRRLDDALLRLHAAGFRAAFPAASTPCGDGLPWVGVQSPRAPAEASYGSVVTMKFAFSPVPSPGFPARHARWTRVPRLVGLEYRFAAARLQAIWPCVHVRAANGTPAWRMVVVAQRPRAGTRVRAYGVRIGRHGFRPTIVDVTVAAR
jgi:hypothetical protein